LLVEHTQIFKGDTQQFPRSAACYIDKLSLDPLLCALSTWRYTDITFTLYVHTVNWKTPVGRLT